MKGPAEVAHGPMFIGFFVNVLLYGIMTTQLYIYFNSYRKDRTWIKLFVILLFLCDTVNTVFDFVYLYGSLIIHFADVEYLGNADWVFATDPAMTAIIAILVQGFFAWRIKVLTGNLWLVSLVIACSLTGLVGGVITAFEVGHTPQFVNFRDFKWVVIMCMLWGYSNHHHSGLPSGEVSWSPARSVSPELEGKQRRHKTGFQASDDVVDRIIRLTVQTGLVTAICAIVDLVLFLTDPTGTFVVSSQKMILHEIPQDAPSQVLVHVESHEIRDLETTPRPTTARSNRRYRRSPEGSGEKEYETDSVDGMPTAILAIKQDHDDGIPFESYRRDSEAAIDV